MADALVGRVDGDCRRRARPQSVATYDFSGERAIVQLDDGRAVAARLVIGADGRASPARRAAGLAVHAHRYPQSALTVFLSHRLPHCDVSTEFHTREGPFTLVPLPPRPSAPNRSSLVWVMSDAEAARREALDDRALAREIERQARSMLGAMRIEGQRGLFPMIRQIVPKLTAPRLALVGDAAHAFPPIGAQGLNLGLRDVEAIVEAAVAARADGGDIGGDAALKSYRARAPARYPEPHRRGRRAQPGASRPLRPARLRPGRRARSPRRGRAAPAPCHAGGGRAPVRTSLMGPPGGPRRVARPAERIRLAPFSVRF